jgi:hypothetical protein
MSGFEPTAVMGKWFEVNDLKFSTKHTSLKDKTFYITTLCSSMHAFNNVILYDFLYIAKCTEINYF